MSHRVSVLWIAIAVLGVAAISGCGATGPPTQTTAKNGSNRALQFSQCMRSNGVPNFPDPGPSGYQLGPNSGLNLQSPAGRTAINACQKDLPQSGAPTTASASERHAQVVFANCMRAHGVPNFPDPGANGWIQFPITSPIRHEPGFQRAQSGPCKKYLNDG